MKKLLALLLSLSLIPIAALPASAEEDTRQFQWSQDDKTTPKGFPSDWDLDWFSVGLTVDDELEIFGVTKGGVTDGQFSYGGNFILYIDTNLDKKTDFQISSVAIYDSNTLMTATLLDSNLNQVQDCQAYTWVTPKQDAVAWRIPKSCLSLRTEVNFSMRSTFDEVSFDLVPDKGAWQKFKTQYMKVAACNSAEKNSKVTYSGTTYICLKSGSKWAWKDYGPIAAKNAKWLTEKAYYSCKLNGKYGATIEDGGKTLTLDGAYLYFITEKDYLCVTKVLKMPASVERRVSITRALDGMQEASWGKISAFWNYHPDSGLNITFSYN